MYYQTLFTRLWTFMQFDDFFFIWLFSAILVGLRLTKFKILWMYYHLQLNLKSQRSAFLEKFVISGAGDFKSGS